MASAAADGARSPKFSVVIPTRNSAYTLPFTLLTCLRQDFDDFEIVVADNASTDGTREVVEALASDKIRYFRSEEALSMTENWNRALSYARGDWITFLGSDDGLRSGTLSTLDRAVSENDVRSVGWSHSIYTWPDLAYPAQAGKLSIPPSSELTQIVKTKPRLIDMLSGDSLPTVPSIYYGLKHRSLITRALESGPVFEGRTPDVFSAVLFAALEEEFLEIAQPLTLTGLSDRSNGMAHLPGNSSHPTRQDFAHLNAVNQLRFHDELPDVILVCVVVWDALFRVRDRLSFCNDQLRLPPDVIAQACLDHIFAAEPDRSAEVDAVLDFMKEHGCTLPDRTELLSRPAAEPPPFLPLDGEVGYAHDQFVIDASEFGVTDVGGAAELVDSMVRFQPLFEMQREALLKETAERIQEVADDRDAWVAHAEALAVERDALVADRDAWVAHGEALAVERDALVADRDAWVAHAEALAVERDALVADRDAHSA